MSAWFLDCSLRVARSAFFLAIVLGIPIPCSPAAGEPQREESVAYELTPLWSVETSISPGTGRGIDGILVRQQILSTEPAWIVAHGSNFVDAYRAADGARIWGLEPEFGYLETAPVIVGDRVIIQFDSSRIECRALHTGELLWGQDLGDPNKIMDLAACEEGILIRSRTPSGNLDRVDAPSPRTLWGCRLTDGKLLWRYADPGLRRRNWYVGEHPRGAILHLSSSMEVLDWRTGERVLKSPVRIDADRIERMGSEVLCVIAKWGLSWIRLADFTPIQVQPLRGSTSRSWVSPVHGRLIAAVLDEYGSPNLSVMEFDGNGQLIRRTMSHVPDRVAYWGDFAGDTAWLASTLRRPGEFIHTLELLESGGSEDSGPCLVTYPWGTPPPFLPEVLSLSEREVGWLFGRRTSDGLLLKIVDPRGIPDTGPEDAVRLPCLAREGRKDWGWSVWHDRGWVILYHDAWIVLCQVVAK